MAPLGPFGKRKRSEMPATDTADLRRNPSILQMVKDLRNDASTLVRQEVALAKKEMSQKVARMGRNAVFLAMGSVASLYGIFFILLALSNLLFAGLAKAGFSGSVANWFAPVLVGMGMSIVALTLVLKGLRSMRKASAVPEKTMETLRDDRDWVKGKLK